MRRASSQPRQERLPFLPRWVWIALLALLAMGFFALAKFPPASPPEEPEEIPEALAGNSTAPLAAPQPQRIIEIAQATLSGGENTTGGERHGFLLPIPNSSNPEDRMEEYRLAFLDLAEKDPANALRELQLWLALDAVWANDLWQTWLEAETENWEDFLFPLLTDCLQLLPVDDRAVMAEFLLPGLAAQDPIGTSGWLETLTLSVGESHLTETVWQVGWRAKPGAVFEELLQADPSRQNQLIQAFRDVVEFSLADWAVENSSQWPVFPDELFLLLAEELSLREPELAWQWVGKRFHPAENPALFLAAAENWARESPGEALLAAQQLPPGATALATREKILEVWQTLDPEAVARFRETGEIPVFLQPLPGSPLEPPGTGIRVENQ